LYEYPKSEYEVRSSDRWSPKAKAEEQGAETMCRGEGSEEEEKRQDIPPDIDLWFGAEVDVDDE